MREEKRERRSGRGRCGMREEEREGKRKGRG